MPGLENPSVTSAYILLARIQSRDYTQLQGVLGNVVQEKKMVGLGGTYNSLCHIGCVFVVARVTSGMRGKASDLWEGISGLAVLLTSEPVVSDETYFTP